MTNTGPISVYRGNRHTGKRHNLTSQSDLAEKYRHVYSASGVLGLMDDALWASERIPDTITPFEAANEFCSFSLPKLREPEEKAGGKSMSVPRWFARS